MTPSHARTDYLRKLGESVQYLRNTGRRADIAIVLGSGQGDFAASIEDPLRIPYEDIPNFPSSSVAGHGGALIFGRIEGRDVAVMQGRVHCYEGYSSADVAFGVLALASFGAERFILTNAAGCLNTAFNVGDLMLIDDHITLLCEDPSTGAHAPELGERFYSQIDPYCPDINDRLTKAALQEGITLRRGVYFYAKGPRYESKADIKAMRLLGADAVAMSTVPEVLALKNFGIKNVVGISLLTNYAAGINASNPNHEEVLAVARTAGRKLDRVLRMVIAMV